MGFLLAVLSLSLNVAWITGLAIPGPCAHFTFPEVEDEDTVREIKAQLNTTITLNFEITTDPGCALDNEFTISVRVRDADKFGDFCSIRQKGGFCQIPLEENGCGCLAGKGKYQLKKTITRMDDTKWLLAAGTNMVKERELEFKVIYPPVITNLSIESANHPDGLPPVVEPQTPLDVICRWQNGQPAVTSARLLDRHGVEMEGNTINSGEIRYKFAAVGCQDAGLIQCQAAGARQNKSAMLLVKCVPEFDSIHSAKRYVGIGQNDLNFNVRTHTTDILTCTLTRVTSGEEKAIVLPTQGHDGRGFCRLSGTPPDLELTVGLDDVRKEEEGKWRLELTNHVGKGHVDFQMQFVEGTWTTRTTTTTTRAVGTSQKLATIPVASSLPVLVPTTTAVILPPATLQTVAISQDSASVNWNIVGPSVGVGFIVLVVIVVVVVVVCRKKGRADVKRRPHPDRELPCVPVSNIEYHCGYEAGRSSLLGEHDYVDIADVQTMKRVAAVDADDYLCPNPRASARAGTYEHPLTSQDYVPPRPVYEPLRHLYDTFNQWRTKTRRRSAQI